MTDAYLSMSDHEFMTLHRSRIHHEPVLAARLTQQSLIGRGRAVRYTPNGGAPSAGSTKIASECARRGLEFPADWVLAGLRDEREDF
jgi:hypothetical protein